MLRSLYNLHFSFRSRMLTFILLAASHVSSIGHHRVDAVLAFAYGHAISATHRASSLDLGTPLQDARWRPQQLTVMFCSHSLYSEVSDNFYRCFTHSVTVTGRYHSKRWLKVSLTSRHSEFRCCLSEFEARRHLLNFRIQKLGKAALRQDLATISKISWPYHQLVADDQ